jgi:5-methylcytosine-specific restriction protein B
LARYDGGPIYSAAKEWAQRCLTQDGSIFSDELQLWALAILDELDRRFVQNLDEGEGNFFEKLKAQLGGGSSQCHQLMAEALWILMLFQSKITAATKRENVAQVWSWSGAELPEVHPMLSETVLSGLGSAGAAYNTQRWRELSFLITALRDFKRQAHNERERMLEDGWSFAEWLTSLPGARNRQLRHILPHLLFPDLFERISSEGDKRLILAFHLGMAERELRKWDLIDIDRALLDLRHKLEERHTREIDFYEEEFSGWRDTTRSWLLSWNPKNWDWVTLADDRAKTRAGDVVTHDWRCASTAPREGDHVFLVRAGVEPKGIVALGSVARAPYNAPHYNPERAGAGDTTQYIDVDFTDIRDATQDPILALDTLQREVPDQTWNPQSSGIEIKPRAAQRLSRLWKQLPTTRLEKAPISVGPIKAPDLTEPLNLILYGPPGTGKTYRLQQTYMPRYTDKDGQRFEFITFHQSYAYEDFVEGIRPVTVAGSVTYEVRSGVLRRLCDRARQDPGRRYGLFIDEINRGNVAKIFGELITLIEGDKRLRFDADGNKKGLEITLPYSGERFGVPANVDLIGTMNTADRSIALLDTALRRRFQFEELMPNVRHIDSQGSGVIPDGAGGEIDLRQLLDTMNARLMHLLHRDRTVGHAYFTKVRSFADLRSVMAREILPLLQEYFYDDWRHIRLVLADQTVSDREYQLVRQISTRHEDLFPSTETAELGERHVFEVTPEAEITPDAIRKIYEPR